MSIESLAALFEESNIMFVVIFLSIFNIAIVAVEAVIDRSTKQPRNWMDSLANTTIFIVTQVAEKTFYGALFFVALLPFYYWFAVFTIPMTVISWAFAILAADFTYYWMHRVEHQYRLLWAHHSVHHSSEDYNLTIAFRLCIFESLLTWIFLVPMIVIGFNPFQTTIAFILIVQYQAWIHTAHIGKIKGLEGVINTPSAHRVHHGSNPTYLDKNFGSVLMIWDRLFGTYQPEEETVKFGLTENINTNHPVEITLFEYKRLWRDIKAQKHWRRKLAILLGKLSAPQS